MLKLPTPQVSRRDAKALIGERIKEGRRASMESYETSSKRAERRYATWDRRNYEFLIELFDSDEIAKEYDAIPKLVLTGTYRSTERAEQHQKRIDRKVKWFKELDRRIDNHFPQVEEAVPNLTSSETLSALDKVDLLCSRFYAVVNQLHQPKRGNKSPSRSSLKSEYDVQELLHALLWIFFSDVRREDPVPQRGRGEARFGNKDVDGAIADYSKAIELAPKHVYAYYNRGLARFAKKDAEGAIADYTKVIELTPGLAAEFDKDAVAARAKYDLTRYKNDLSSADSYLASANEQRSLYAAAYNSRGHTYVVKGSDDLAIADYTKLIELEPSKAVHYKDRAKVYRSMKKLRLAIADERRAAKLEKQ